MSSSALPSLSGKTILLTGATEGIGKAAARQLSRLGADLTLVARSREKGERLLAELRQAGGGALELLVGDLSTLDGIRGVAAAFRRGHGRLDVLANNAGGVFARRILTADGFEMTFALNHLGYFLLTTELVDLIQQTPGARVISTSSGAHLRGRIDLDDIASRPSGKAGFGPYCDSKLANILFTRELARRIAPAGAVAHCFHPGFVRTGFGQNNDGLLKLAIGAAAALFARTPEQGADTLVWLVASDEAGRSTGGYFMDRQPGRMSAAAKDDAMAARLWQQSERWVASGAQAPASAG